MGRPVFFRARGGLDALMRTFGYHPREDFIALERHMSDRADQVRQDNEALQAAITVFAQAADDLDFHQEQVRALPPDAPKEMLWAELRRKDQVIIGLAHEVKTMRERLPARDKQGRFVAKNKTLALTHDVGN